jgi:Cys-tRNA(Pro)/Cys-tRNA(Cys) deacylase
VKTSVDVHNYLLERDVPHELVPLQGRPRSADRVAAVLGLPPQQVGRVLLFDAGGRSVAALVPADREANPSLVAGALGGGHVEALPPDRASDLTGYLDEAMPPVGLPEDTEVVVDQGLSDEEVLYFPGGEVSSVLKIRAVDLIRVTGAAVARIAR